MTAVQLRNLTKLFPPDRAGRPPTRALDDLTLDVAAGELFFLLGPSGCGKSTLLRLIAGLHEPTGGRILFNGKDVTALPTEKRNAVMCFQSYALWPHLTVRQNVAFGLGVRGVAAAERDRRVDEVLALVRMADFAGRKPNQLSGGQQQRVALARAIAVRPDLLLLDEPLSNLDAKLRQEMRGEIRRICKATGFTTLYVTHDQKEALSVADRIAVMDRGRLAQVGTPADLYHRPRSAFVADFIGATNLVPGRVVGREGDALRIETAAGPILAATLPAATGPDALLPAAGGSEATVPAGGRGNPEAAPGQVMLSIRPEQLRVARGGPGADRGPGVDRPGVDRPGVNRLVGRTLESTFLGESSEHLVQVREQKLRVVCSPPLLSAPAELAIEFDPADVVVLAE